MTIHRIRLSWLACTLSAVVVLGATTAIFADDPVSVSMIITVHDHQGVPLQSVPLDVGSHSDRKLVQTGQDGVVVVNIGVNESDTELVARLSRGAYYDLPPLQKAEVLSRHTEYVQNYAFENRYVMPLQPDQVEYSINITAHEAVAIAAQPAFNDGTWPDVGAFVRGGAWADYFVAPRPFIARGIRKGMSTQLFLQTDNGQVHAIDLSAEQTADDTDLGLILVDMAVGESELRLTMAEHIDLWGPDTTLLEHHVALIRVDGQVIYAFPVHPEEHWAYTRVAGGVIDRPNIAAGEYYVVPGLFGHPLSLRVFDLVRAGNIALLNAVGVPKVTCVPGETATITINARDARDAIYAASGGP